MYSSLFWEDLLSNYNLVLKVIECVLKDQNFYHEYFSF